MGKGKPLNEVEKAKISTLKDYNNMTNRQIAKEIGRSKDVIGNFLKNRENYGKKYTSGGRSTITSAEKRRLIRNAGNSFKSARQLKSENDLSIGIRRIQQILSGSPHLKYKKMKRRPMLSKANVESRQKFALTTYAGQINGKKLYFLMKRSSIWTVQMDWPIIGMICEPNQRFSASANLAVDRLWFGVRLATSKICHCHLFRPE